jgi:hypothetical protein
LKTSAAIGTVLLTGLLMIATHASGQACAMPSHRPATMPALMLNRSSRVMPGLRGTPVVGRWLLLSCGLMKSVGRAKARRATGDATAQNAPPPPPPLARRFARKNERTGGDDDELAAAQRVEQLRLAGVARDLGGARDVREVGRDAGSVGDIKQAEFADEGVLLEQQRERLADASGGAEHGDLGLVWLVLFADDSAIVGRGREVVPPLCRVAHAASLRCSLARKRWLSKRTLEADDPGRNCAARRLTRSIGVRGHARDKRERWMPVVPVRP